MTQAFNLAQLANNLNTSGQLDATDGLNGLVATSNLATGTANSTTYLRGDQTWAALAVSSSNYVNRIINGAMMISQRYVATTISNPTNNQYVIDRWKINTSFTGSCARNLGSVTPPAGFTNYLGMSVGASGQSVNNYGFIQNIEAINTYDLGFGTANAKTITVSFWVRSSLTGQFGFSIQNEAGNRSYPVGYTITSANTWQKVTATIPGDTSGTWAGATNGVGLQLYISYGALSARQGTSGAWASADYRSVTGQVDLVTNNGATFYITGVQLEVGSTATDFSPRPYGEELMLCQRYWEKSWQQDLAIGQSHGTQVFFRSYNQSTNFMILTAPMKVTKRTAPTVTAYDANGNAGKCCINDNISDPCNISITSIGANGDGTVTGQLNYGGFNGFSFAYAADAEL